MNTEEMKERLLNEFKVDKEILDGFSKKEQFVNLMNILSETESEPTIQLEDFEVNMPKEIEVDHPQRSSVGWTEYVKSLLEDDEKIKEYPKTDGLKRLVELLIGPILGVETDVLQYPSDTNRRATAKSRITILDNMLNRTTVFEGSADAAEEHIDYPYNKFLTALAETRAEGRAYRKALRLKNTVAAEELDYKDLKDKPSSQPAIEYINSNQIMFLQKMCENSDRGMNINIEKLCEKILGKKSSIKQYTREDGAVLSEKLSEFQHDITKIDPAIKGYDPLWKSSKFGI